MEKRLFNRRSALIFKHFNRKGYSLFAALGKEVLIGVLSVSTLTYAKANSISTKPATASATGDSLSFGEQQLDEVQVMGSRAPLTALQSAKIVEVVSRDEIHRAEAQSLNDVLKLATGVDVRQRGGFGVQTDISINGGTFDQITILLNGMPLTSPQTGHNAADFPVSVDDIERIEVLEGASSRVFGSSAFSGAINIVTRQDASRYVQLGAEAGSFGSFGGNAAVNFNTSRTTHRLSGGYTQSDGGTTNSDFIKRRGFYQGSYSSEPLRLDWQAGIASQDYGANTFYSARFPNQWEATRRYMASASAGYRPFWQSSSSVARSLHLTPMLYGHRDYDHYQLTKYQTGAAAGENYHRMDVYGAQLGIDLSWLLGKTALGLDIRKEHILSTAYGEQLDSTEWKDIHGSDRKYSREGNRTNTSIFLEHNVLLGGLTLSMGVMANKNTGLDGDFRFYPGIDLSYRPDQHWKLYASWNKALRLPTFTDLYTSNKAQQGDLNLKAEKNSSFKVGARYRHEVFDALLSAFYSKGTNMIDWVYETETSTRYHALNIGKLDNMGFNVETNINLSRLFSSKSESSASLPTEEGWGGAVGSASRGASLKLAYAYIHQKHNTEHTIYRSLYALEYLRHKFVAELSAPLFSSYSHSIGEGRDGATVNGHGGTLWFSTALRWQQRMNGYHPYAKWDAKLMWDAASYSLYVKADNLTCHRYYDLGGVLQPGLWIMAGGSIKLKL